ncbi:MAG: short-chain dehydrogenase/reductase [Myxococcaceae bacterium]|nr:short-chain dehydrogenase/reductase [Myxococcaceae bacterium]
MKADFGLAEKVVIVTGSTRGIGSAIAEAFAAEGAHVVVNGVRDPAQVEARAQELAARYGVQTLALTADAADPRAVAGVYQAVFKRFKRLDVLVHAAGIMRGALIGMIADELVSATLQVNLAGAIHHLQGAAKLMARNKSGSIVNISSLLGVQGTEGQSVYAASKAGVVGLTLAAAKELAPQGIRVNAIAPGFIDTDLTAALSADKRAEFLARIRLGRVGQPRDVANAALFLGSELAGFVTGQVLAVDGSMQL